MVKQAGSTADEYDDVVMMDVDALDGEIREKDNLGDTRKARERTRRRSSRRESRSPAIRGVARRRARISGDEGRRKSRDKKKYECSRASS